MKTQNEVKDYALAASGWLYVWGANGEEIRPELPSLVRGHECGYVKTLQRSRL